MDIFMADVGDRLFVWVGCKASKAEREGATIYAQRYLGINDRPKWLPITTVQDSCEPEYFWKNFK
jgi:hypothetical protein